MFDFILAVDVNIPGKQYQFFKRMQTSIPPAIGWRMQYADWDSEGSLVTGVYVNQFGVVFVQFEPVSISQLHIDEDPDAVKEELLDFSDWIEQNFDQDLYRAPMTAF